MKKYIVCGCLLTLVGICGFTWLRTARGVPASPAQRLIVLSPPKLPPQGEHESFLEELPNGEYFLPVGRFLTEEDVRKLAATPDIKLIRNGKTPGTIEYGAVTRHDPVATADYLRRKSQVIEEGKKVMEEIQGKK
jgi:hypothetical protein